MYGLLLMRFMIFSPNAAVLIDIHQVFIGFSLNSLGMMGFQEIFKKNSSELIRTFECISKVPPIHPENCMGAPHMMSNKM